jgi:hypothetical protein
VRQCRADIGSIPMSFMPHLSIVSRSVQHAPFLKSSKYSNDI